ncbi:MAG: CopG family transcriptional regulator [Prevotella sp.]|jgi:predicted RNase H-like HicB family nuclease|nr:CopG family transcriptional regulator [Prevotella sp.]MBR7048717.1 CopG family transcriptional regulator [Prevotella sp.]
MEKIRVDVQWCDKNFGASLGDNVPGAVVVTAKTYEELQREVPESLRFHVEGMLQDGDDVPQWLVNGDYELDYNLVDVTTVLRAYEPFVSLAALSHASGINQHQLSHYANGIKHPRPQQRKRIIDGMHKIGRELLSVE